MIATRSTLVRLGFVFITAGAAAAGCSSSAANGPGGGTGATGFGGQNNYGGSGNTNSGGDNTGNTGNTGTGNTGNTGNGGSGNAAGSTGSGGTSGSGDFAGSTVQACPGSNAVMVSSLGYQPCTLDGCTLATCVPTGVVSGTGVNASILANCDGDAGATKCVPNSYVTVLGKFLAKTCTSLLSAEGRCISTCVPQVAVQSTTLPKDVCADSELCAPCFNPIDGTSTGACTEGCDTGPKDATVHQFASCGSGAGLCVPKALVPQNLLTALPVETCTGTDELCAPIDKVKNLKFKFPACDAQIAPAPPDTTKPAACVPKYIIDWAANSANPNADGFASALTQSNCTKAGDICAPCADPLSGKDTGACG